MTKNGQFYFSIFSEEEEMQFLQCIQDLFSYDDDNDDDDDDDGKSVKLKRC